MSAHDPVNKPSHYQIMPGVEVYDVRMALMTKIEGASHEQVDDWSRAWEYLTRMWGKNGLEDAKKARWYLDKLIGKLEASATIPSFDWSSLGGCQEPAAHIDDESDRQKAVEQNGNDGAVYQDPWYGAPAWAEYKAQDADGAWCWFDARPVAMSNKWVCQQGVDRTWQFVAPCADHTPNPNWRDTLISR